MPPDICKIEWHQIQAYAHSHKHTLKHTYRDVLIAHTQTPHANIHTARDGKLSVKNRHASLISIIASAQKAMVKLKRGWKRKGEKKKTRKVPSGWRKKTEERNLLCWQQFKGGGSPCLLQSKWQFLAPLQNTQCLVAKLLRILAQQRKRKQG